VFEMPFYGGLSLFFSDFAVKTCKRRAAKTEPGDLEAMTADVGFFLWIHRVFSVSITNGRDFGCPWAWTGLG
jgi:hypothetical protein